MDWVDWVLLIARVVVVFFALLLTVMILVWMERKVIADMQTRVGPMRAGPRGILITIADGIKLFFKEGITPTMADRPVYLIGGSELSLDTLADTDELSRFERMATEAAVEQRMLVVCVYDRTLPHPAHVEASIETHPLITSGGAVRRNEDYVFSAEL